MYKRVLKSLVYACAEFIPKTIFYNSSPEWNEFTMRVDRFFKYFNLDTSNEYRDFCRIVQNAGPYGEDSKSVKMMGVLMALNKYENKIPQYFDRIFISHSSKDVDIVKPFVDMLSKIGLSKDKLFCSSIDGYGIPQRENIYEFLKREFTDKNTFVVMIMSDNYYNSKPSLNEMGAAWVMSKEYVSILIKGFEFNQIEGAADAQKIGFKIEDTYRLDEFKDNLVKELRINNPISNWGSIRDGFLAQISKVNKSL